MQRAVDGDDIALSKHILEVFNAAAADLLLNLGLQWLVVIVEQLLAVERLQTAQHTLANAAHGDGTDDLTLEVELVLRDRGHIPLSTGDLLVGRDEVADQGENGHDNMLGNGDNVAASNLGDGDTAIGLVGSIQVNVVGANTGGDGELQVLCLGQAFGSQVARVEATMVSSQPFQIST